MIDRRTVLHGTTLGGAFAALMPNALEPGGEAAEQGASAASERAALEEVSRAVTALRDELRRQHEFGEIASVRDALRAFLRATGKFPDYIDVGTDVWQQVYDWHVRYRQPINVARNAEGRYTIVLMSSMLVMRPDVQASYIGLPYDSR